MTNLSDTLAALSEAATQGEWHQRHDDEIWSDQFIGTFTPEDGPFIVALVNAYRTGQLVPVPSVERVARAMFRQAYADATGGSVPSDSDPEWQEYVSQATAVIAVMQEGRDG